MNSQSSQRLFFRPLEVRDLNEFYTLESDPEVLKYYRRPVARDKEEAKKNLLHYVEYAEKYPGLGAFSVFLKTDNSFIGIAVLIHLNKDPENLDIEIGYRLQRKFWGAGYGTEIAEALLQYAFKKLNLNQVLATTHPDNLVSQKVLKKCGFEYIGENNYHGGICKVFKKANTQKDSQ